MSGSVLATAGSICPTTCWVSVLLVLPSESVTVASIWCAPAGIVTDERVRRHRVVDQLHAVHVERDLAIVAPGAVAMAVPVSVTVLPGDTSVFDTRQRDPRQVRSGNRDATMLTALEVGGRTEVVVGARREGMRARRWRS